MSVSRSAVELIKAFEGFRGKAARLDDGRWTIGYGHTLTAREGAEVTEPDAEALLLYDLIQAAHAVNELVYTPLNQNEFDALVSFVFNIGLRNFRGSVTYRRLNEGRPLEAAMAMDMWRKADLEGERIVIDALVRRRAEEKALFLRPIEGWTAAPTPVLPPKFDYDAVGVMPLQTPVAAHAPLGGERAFAEREQERVSSAPVGPSASEVAAAAVIERLETLMTETERGAAGHDAAVTHAGPAETEPSEARAAQAAGPKLGQPVSAAQDAPLVFAQTRQPLARPRRPGLLVVVGMAIIGVALVAIAVAAGLQPRTALEMGIPTPAAGLAIGVVGVVVAAVSAYFLLERLGQSGDRLTR
jgi:lysozyme